MKVIGVLYQALSRFMPEETVLVAETMGEGRRLLGQCSARGLLMGVRPATVRSLALELTAPVLGKENGPRLMEAGEAGDLMFRCLQAMPPEGFFAGEHARDRSTAELMFRVIDELNRGHIGPIGGNARKDAVQALREAYSRAKGSSLLDEADLLDLAAECARKGDAPKGRHYVVLGSMLLSKQERAFLDLLTEGCLIRVPVDLPEGLELPDTCYDPGSRRQAVDASAFRFVRCRGEETQQRFVFRDILSRGEPAEDCAVIAMNRDLSAGLFDRAQYYGLSAGVAGGTPASGSRVCCALHALKDWQQKEYDAEVLRSLLLNHALTVPGQAALIRRLREKAVGWSKPRYESCLMKGEEGEQTPDSEMLAGWKAFLDLLFLAAEQQGTMEEQKRVLASLLDSYIPVCHAIDASALAAAKGRLQHISWIAEGETVLGRLLELLEQTGVQSGREEDGSLYVSTLAEGFCTGRRTLYVCGLSRFCLQSRTESPLLLDEEKAELGLPTLRDREQENLFRLCLLLAQHEGEVILTYCDYDTERMIPLLPAPVFRRLLGEREAEAVSFVSSTAYTLGEQISRGESLAVLPVPSAEPEEELEPAALGEARPWDELLDKKVFSPTSLEEALSCPFKFWLKRLVGLRPAELPERGSDVWLNAAELGTLCHAVLEQYYQNDGQTGEKHLAAILTRETEALRLNHTPAPEATILRDIRRAEQMIRRAIQWTEENSASVLSTEKKFGPQAGGEPLVLEIGGRQVRLSGSIDRVDRMQTGETAILDYKTGKSDSYRNHPERYLQPYLYALAAEKLNPGLQVTESGYLFLKNGAEYLPVSQSPEARREKEFALASLLAWMEEEEGARIAAPAFVSDAKRGIFRPGSPEERREALKDCSKYCEFEGLCPAMRQICQAEENRADREGDDGDE